jgi:DNA-binding NarL/FixJ family response regulator
LAATRANLLRGGGEEVHGLENDAAIRVLLADDDEGYAASLQLLIEEQPELTVVGVAHDGEEAIDLVKRLEPDAVVVDLHMPRVDVVAAVAHLRREHPRLCLIALTGDSDLELHRAATDAGAAGVLVKGEIVDALFERLHGAQRS